MSSLQRHGGWSRFSNSFSRQQSSSLPYQPWNYPPAHNVDNQGFLRSRRPGPDVRDRGYFTRVNGLNAGLRNQPNHRDRGYVTPTDYPVNNPNTGARDQRLPQRDRGYITPIDFPVNNPNTGARDQRLPQNQRGRDYLTPIDDYPSYLQPATGSGINNASPNHGYGRRLQPNYNDYLSPSNGQARDYLEPLGGPYLQTAKSLPANRTRPNYSMQASPGFKRDFKSGFHQGYRPGFGAEGFEVMRTSGNPHYTRQVQGR